MTRHGESTARLPSALGELHISLVPSSSCLTSSHHRDDYSRAFPSARLDSVSHNNKQHEQNDKNSARSLCDVLCAARAHFACLEVSSSLMH